MRRSTARDACDLASVEADAAECAKFREAEIAPVADPREAWWLKLNTETQQASGQLSDHSAHPQFDSPKTVGRPDPKAC